MYEVHGPVHKHTKNSKTKTKTGSHPNPWHNQMIPFWQVHTLVDNVVNDASAVKVI